MPTGNVHVCLCVYAWTALTKHTPSFKAFAATEWMKVKSPHTCCHDVGDTALVIHVRCHSIKEGWGGGLKVHVNVAPEPLTQDMRKLR